MGGLRNGLDLAKLGQKLRSDSSTPEEVMVIFLTDGQPNVEESDPQEIIKYIRQKNTGLVIMKFETSRSTKLCNRYFIATFSSKTIKSIIDYDWQ